jgi:hypothetical protein
MMVERPCNFNEELLGRANHRYSARTGIFRRFHRCLDDDFTLKKTNIYKSEAKCTLHRIRFRRWGNLLVSCDEANRDSLPWFCSQEDCESVPHILDCWKIYFRFAVYFDCMTSKNILATDYVLGVSRVHESSGPREYDTLWRTRVG